MRNESPQTGHAPAEAAAAAALPRVKSCRPSTELHANARTASLSMVKEVQRYKKGLKKKRREWHGRKRATAQRDKLRDPEVRESAKSANQRRRGSPKRQHFNFKLLKSHININY